MKSFKRREFLKSMAIGTSSLLIPKIDTSRNTEHDQPNIILIMADDLGYECLSCNGSESYQTPNLDQLAKTGIRFEHCYSQPLCTPSRVQIMTGRYNFRNYKMFGFFDLRETTFGHVLKNAGYQTCIAGKWQLSNGIEGPFLAGFDEYCLWQIYTNVAGKDVRGSRYADPKIHQNGQLLQDVRGKYGPDIFCDFINNFIERHQDNPFCVYYPMALTHDPFVPTPMSEDWNTQKSRKDEKYFADMVFYMDLVIGRIIHRLEELKLREKTIVIFTSDNGTHQRIRSKFKGQWLQGGKGEMTDAGTHVPLIVNWPGSVPGGQVSSALIDFTDFFPTLSDIAGAPIPERIKIDGVSFYPQLSGSEGNPREWVFMHYWGRGRNIFQTRRCVRNQRWKLYDDGNFFDITSDPFEQHPIEPSKIVGELAILHKQFQSVFEAMK